MALTKKRRKYRKFRVKRNKSRVKRKHRRKSYKGGSTSEEIEQEISKLRQIKQANKEESKIDILKKTYKKKIDDCIKFKKEKFKELRETMGFLMYEIRNSQIELEKKKEELRNSQIELEKKKEEKKKFVETHQLRLRDLDETYNCKELIEEYKRELLSNHGIILEEDPTDV